MTGVLSANQHAKSFACMFLEIFAKFDQSVKDPKLLIIVILKEKLLGITNSV